MLAAVEVVEIVEVLEVVDMDEISEADGGLAAACAGDAASRPAGGDNLGETPRGAGAAAKTRCSSGRRPRCVISA